LNNPAPNSAGHPVYDTPRRLFLRLAVKLLFLLGVLAFIYILFAATGEETGTTASRKTPLQVTIPQSGQFQRIPWQGGNILLLRRNKELLTQLNRHNAQLLDPDSIAAHQPANLPSPGRSLRPELFVAFDRGTDLGCPLQWIAPDNPRKAPLQPWPGGFRDTCGGSWYDAAGRVFKGQNATRNLDIPDYRLDGVLLEIGTNGDNPVPAN
jgi:ubiquinol-cytochrome c reductase iron-sulfur subunit